MRKLLIVALLLLAVQAMAMDPDPMLKQLQIFAIRYDCTGIAYANPMAPEHPTRATVTGEWTLGGQWVAFSYLEKKTAQSSMPFGVRGYFGYDPQVKKFVVGTVDNMGGYATGASDGWDGDTIVFTGPWHMGTQTLESRDTFMKTAAGLKHIGELEMDGKWVKLGQETCTRAKK
jgi:hypothetical protein